ncbi:hypothetical protein M3Y96_00584100 [Aphelenchoides besseyi]|nr:hypothetical protein M3Y96_00584100 [Aphelenchoides besseyi]
MIGKSSAVYTAVLNRYVAARPIYKHKFLQKLFNGLHTSLYLTLVTLFSQLFITTLIYLVDSDQQALKSQLAYRDPTLKQLFAKEPSVFCYELDFYASLFYIAIFIVAGFSLIGCPFLLYRLRHHLRENRATLSPMTFRLQWTMYISIVAQSISGLLFLIFPNISILAGVVLHFTNAFVFSALICVFMSLQVDRLKATFNELTFRHSVVDSVILLGFIRPYREFVFRSFRRFNSTPQLSSRPSTCNPINNWVDQNPLKHRRLQFWSTRNGSVYALNVY